MEDVVLHCTSNGSHKEYRIEPDPVGLRVVARHGRIGARLATTLYNCSSINAVDSKATALEEQKRKKGYVVVGRTPIAGYASSPLPAAPDSVAPTAEDWRLTVSTSEPKHVDPLLRLAPITGGNWNPYLTWFKVRKLPNGGVGVQGRASPETDPEGAVALLAMGRLLGTQPVDSTGNFVNRTVIWTEVADMSVEVLRLVEASGLVRRPLDVTILTRGIEAASPWAGTF